MEETRDKMKSFAGAEKDEMKKAIKKWSRSFSGNSEMPKKNNLNN